MARKESEAMTNARTTPAEAPKLEATRSGVWRHEVLDRVGRLRVEIETIQSGNREIAQTVEDNLDAAEAIGTSGVARFASGRQIENAWRHLRLAEEGLLRLIPDADETKISAAATKALAHARRDLPADDAIAKDLKDVLPVTAQNRALVLRLTQDLTIAAHEARTGQHLSQRAFRNQIRTVTGILAGLGICSVIVLASSPDGGPSGLLPGPNGLKTWEVALLALLMGSMGALFSAVPSLSQVPSQSSPFTPIKDQAALKVAVGAWSAVVGLIVVNAGMSTNQADNAAQAGTLAGFAIMSAFFGASQEALTRFADRKAADVAPSQS
jgi:hypothetical protein